MASEGQCTDLPPCFPTSLQPSQTDHHWQLSMEKGLARAERLKDSDSEILNYQILIHD